jgi:o-succinylbenzoate---CoA ligase
LLLSAACVNRHLHVSEESVWGLALPLHHVGGFGVAARAFEAACDIHSFGGKWDPARFTSWLAETGITHTSLVPAQVHDLVTRRLSAPSSLAAIVVGGGRLDDVQGRRARELGWPVLASYGMTESGSQIATQPPELLDTSYQSASIPILDIWQTRISDEGLLEIAGPALFSGTLVRASPEWNYVKRSSDWHTTSDRVHLDGRLLSPLGRADSLVKVLGELVDPEEIERELVGFSGGLLAAGTFAVTAVPDARAEHKLVPVFLRSVDCELVLNVLRKYEHHAPGYRRLEAPLYVQVIPCSPLGKILRQELRKLAES